MSDDRSIDAQALTDAAKDSEHGESYVVLQGSRDDKIAVGGRIAASDQLTFFMEIVVCLCPDPSDVDLEQMQKKIMFVKKLESRGYSLNCGEGNISCERTLTEDDLDEEYEAVSSIIERLMNRRKNGRG